MEAYSEKVMEHFLHPRNVGEIPDADAIGNVGNPVCVSPETLIQINSDVKEIKNLSRQNLVLSHDGNYHRIVAIRKRHYQGKIHRIAINNLGNALLTPEHHVLALKTPRLNKFLVYKNYTPDWYCAEELQKGDVVLYPIPKGEEDKRYLDFDIEKPKWDFKSKALPRKIEINNDFCLLIGYYLAEGYVRTDKCKGTVGFIFCSKEKKYIKDVLQLMKTVFNVKPTKLTLLSSRTALEVPFYSARLARFFQMHFGKGAQNKHLPHWAMKLPLEKQRALLCGLWRGDGYLDPKRQRAKYVTISRQLAYQLRLLLFRQRIISNFSVGKPYAMHEGSYLLYIQDDESLKKIIKIVGLNIKIKPRLLNVQKTWFDNNFYYTTIRKITPLEYNGSVYNLEVEGLHSYVSNALTLHNCGDILRLYLKVKDNVITEAKFKTFGCLPREQEVVSSDGGWQKIIQVEKHDKVVNGKAQDTLVAETYKREYIGSLVNITPFASPFNSFRLTPNHPVLCVKRKQVQRAKTQSRCKWLNVKHSKLVSKRPDFVPAGDLEEGDYLIFTTNHEIIDNPSFTKEHMRLFGYYLSEGYIRAKGSTVAFAFSKNERKSANEVKQLLFKITGKTAKERIRGSVLEVYICSRKFARFLLKYCGKIARHKSLSKDILQLPFSKQSHLVQTYLRGDGDSYRRRPKNSLTYRITTTSRMLAIQIQEILARGEIFASIREIYKTNCYIEGRKLKESKQYLISFKKERSHRFVHRKGKYFLVPIRRLEKERFRGNVYNFQVVNEPNSYLVKGFVVHNCGAAIATSSMVTELVKGKTIDEALEISNKAVAEALGGLPKIKLHCSVLAEEALKAAIADYYKRKSSDGQASNKKAHA